MRLPKTMDFRPNQRSSSHCHGHFGGVQVPCHAWLPRPFATLVGSRPRSEGCAGCCSMPSWEDGTAAARILTIKKDLTGLSAAVAMVIAIITVFSKQCLHGLIL